MQIDKNGETPFYQRHHRALLFTTRYTAERHNSLYELARPNLRHCLHNKRNKFHIETHSLYTLLHNNNIHENRIGDMLLMSKPVIPHEEDLVFLDEVETPTPHAPSSTGDVWRVMIIDDDADVHSATTF